MIVVEPTVIAVTTPVCVIVATLGSDEIHAIVEPVTTVPALFRVVTVSCMTLPTRNDALGAVTLTLATCGGVGVPPPPPPVPPPPVPPVPSPPPPPPSPPPPPPPESGVTVMTNDPDLPSAVAVTVSTPS